MFWVPSGANCAGSVYIMVPDAPCEAALKTLQIKGKKIKMVSLLKRGQLLYLNRTKYIS